MTLAAHPLPPELARHLPAVREFCLRATRDKHLAEDAVQDAFLIALRRVHTVRDPERLRGWLFRIAQRRVIDLHRAQRRRGIVPLSDEVAAPAPDQGDETHRQTRRVARAIKRLPEKMRLAVKLRYHEGRRLKCVAKRLDVSVDAAKGLLYRARQLLRREFLR